MAGSTISSLITTTVTLGSANYTSPLTVTGSGDIAVSAYAATGIYGPAGGGTVINDGTVIGGAGSASSFAGGGGDGVYLLGGSTATNDGTISGGAGGTGVDLGGDGGVGVYLAGGAALTNQATITGGGGGDATGGSGAAQGSGGAGVVLNGGILANTGPIAGGNGFGGRGYGGSGVILLAGTLTNAGMIYGGLGDIGGGDGSAFFAQDGDGVYLSAGATLVNNNGTIIGGHGLFDGGSGIFVAASSTLAITGVVIGGAAADDAGKGVYLADGGSLGNTGTVLGGAGGDGGSGIDLAQGGTLTNAATIIGGGAYASAEGAGGPGGDGVSLANGGVVVNTAVISGGVGAAAIAGNGGTGGDGVDLTAGGSLTNDTRAIITGGAGGYGYDSGGYGGAGARLIGGSLTNAGTVIGGYGGDAGPFSFGGNGGTGVSLSDGAIVTNTGSIGGGFAGYGDVGGYGGAGVVMDASGAASTLTNSGLITGGNGDDVAPDGTATFFITVLGGDGAYVGTGDTLINTSTINAGTGVYIGAGGALTDDGFISGGDGVGVASSGTLINSGTIISGVGAYLADDATLTNAGTVGGGIYDGVTADAVLFAAGGTLVVDPGGSFVGQVVGSASAADMLYLASGSSAGTLTGLGTQFTNLAQITVGAGAYWALTGANTIDSGTVLTELSGATVTDTGTLVNDGSIVLDPSMMTLAALTGIGGVTTIEAGSTLEVQGTISTDQTLRFGGSGAYLHVDSAYGVAGSITNFELNETIDLKGVDFSTINYSDATGQLTFGDDGDIALSLANGGMVDASASADGADVFVLCFCTNTLILTPAGERPVQELVAGDLVTTLRGEARPIVWIGAGRVLATRGQRNAATPVIVRKGALADNVPNRDLRVTKGHAFWFGDVRFGGVLIPAEFLINHRLIEWDDRAQEVELYHIELATHDVLVANGAPAESYRDDGNRWLFHNANSGWDLPPQVPCAPVLTGGPVVDAIWRRLLERTGRRPGFALTDDTDLHLLVDGHRVDAAERHGTASIFHLPARPVSVRIVSRAGAPAELGLARDPRVLGVALRQIALRQGTRFRVIEAEDDALSEGFHPFEQADDLRWTDGDAALPEALFDGFDGPMELVLHVGGTTRYPLFGATDSLAAA